VIIAPWNVGGVYLKINPVHENSILRVCGVYLKMNPDHDHSVLGIGGIYLKLNPVHDHSTLEYWWCLSKDKPCS